MDDKSLYQVDDVMVDRTALAYCIALGLFCRTHGVPYQEAIGLVKMIGQLVGCSPKDVEAVSYTVHLMAQDPEYLSKHKATDEQIINTMWPDRKMDN
jgi:hypothetical protein